MTFKANKECVLFSFYDISVHHKLKECTEINALNSGAVQSEVNFILLLLPSYNSIHTTQRGYPWPYICYDISTVC